MNSRYRERKYNSTENDRLLRALSQPVQSWDKKWTQHSTAKNLQTFKWVKSDRVIEFEEESEDEPEPMETDQTATQDENSAQASINETAANIESIPIVTSELNATVANNAIPEPSASPVVTDDNSNAITKDADKETTETESKAEDKDSIPGGQSTMFINKSISSVQQEDEEDDSRSVTPKLDDISDEETGNNEEENEADIINDPSRHPASAPHAHSKVTDDEMTNSSVTTPQTTTGDNTPLPMLEDELIPEQQSHPLSQEVLSGASHFLSVNEDIASLNNDSPAIQTPEDRVPEYQHEPMEE